MLLYAHCYSDANHKLIIFWLIKMYLKMLLLL